jgi:hypothetical protein
LDKNELRLHKANQFGDSIKIDVAIIEYTSSFGLSTIIPHLEGEEVFRSVKHKANLAPKLEADSHRHD